MVPFFFFKLKQFSKNPAGRGPRNQFWIATSRCSQKSIDVGTIEFSADPLSMQSSLLPPPNLLVSPSPMEIQCIFSVIDEAKQDNEEHRWKHWKIIVATLIFKIYQV